MTNGITLQAQAPGAEGADLGFWMQSQIIGQPMAMREAHLDNLIETILANRFTLPRSRSHGARITDKGTAIVEIHGILINRAPILGSFWGLTAYEGLGEQFRRLATDPNVKRIVLDVHSPGGLVSGIRACAEALEELADKKPVFSIAHDMACSAGYWLACIAEEMSVTPDGDVGSIGVRAGHVSYARLLEREGIDITTFKGGAAKADYAISELLSPGAAAEEKYSIDRMHDRFAEHVARFRPITAQQARETDARVWVGADAVDQKLADRVETLEELVERVEAGASRVKPKRKPKIEAGSKGGVPPANRNPVPQVPDDEAPSAGKTKGARPMSNQVAADGQTDTAAVYQAAIAGYVAGQKALQGQPPAAPAAAAAQPAAQAGSAGDAVAEATARIFAILDCEEAKDKPAMARKLAGNPKLSVDEAKDLLKAAAPEKAAAADDKSALGNALERQMAKGGNAAGVKPEAVAGADNRPSVSDRVAARYASKKKGA
jgi:signal peptide peptidase SppA